MTIPTKPTTSHDSISKRNLTAGRTTQMRTKDFKGKVDPDWCPGCGDFGVLNCVPAGCAELGYVRMRS